MSTDKNRLSQLWALDLSDIVSTVDANYSSADDNIEAALSFTPSTVQIRTDPLSAFSTKNDWIRD